ncbi:MAG TPA: cupin domain-containing protein [Planctomycetota bacterium]|nr:cupin domain-containing protein [Planctomycetota bacterium]
MPEAHRLDEVRAILTPSLTLIPKPHSADFYEKLDADHDGFRGHSLISEYAFDAAWGVWEMHPHGDELVYLLEGDTDFVLRTEAGDARVRLRVPGEYVIVPRGTWHTAEPHRPTRALFVTPGEGTRNERTPPV